MKAVMMSIKPEWVNEILNGRKKMEVRKTEPRLRTPFRVYIYCTKDKNLLREIDNVDLLGKVMNTKHYQIFNKKWCTNKTLNGKVVAEFICDYEWDIDMEMIMDPEVNTPEEVNSLTTLTDMTIEELNNYLGKKVGYAWNIRDLQIYDEPKELSEFGIKMPPQSWCYVEELK